MANISDEFSDHQTLQAARSVELAERAYRLKDRADDESVRDKLETAGDELIRVDNPARFYGAQSILETCQNWSDDRRSLAHELNVADQELQGEPPMTLAEMDKFLDDCSDSCLSSSLEDIRDLGSMIRSDRQVLSAVGASTDRKVALDSLLTIVEHLLLNSGTITNPLVTDPKIKKLRAVRDTVLVERELVADLKSLITEDQKQKQSGMALKLARETLDEVFKSIDSQNLTDHYKP
jgi:hypothetical protein